MNLFSTTLSGSFLEMLSEILDTLELLHTVSFEFTVKRENGSPVGLEITIQYLLAEQIKDLAARNWRKLVEKRSRKA